MSVRRKARTFHDRGKSNLHNRRQFDKLQARGAAMWTEGTNCLTADGKPKKLYLTRDEARKAVDELERKGRPGLRGYRCANGDHFHVGHYGG